MLVLPSSLFQKKGTMSVQAMSWAIKQKIATDAPARHVLLILANYAGADGEDAFPSVDRISGDTGLSERTVRSKLALLSELGLIEPGNQAIAAAKGYRPDRRPVVYNMRFDRWKIEHALPRKDGVHMAHPERNGVQLMHERGAALSVTGCDSCTQTIKEPSRNRNTPLIPQGGKVEDIQSRAFEAFWQAYPSYRRSGGKEKVRRSFEKAVKADGLERVISGLRACVEIWPSDKNDPNCRLVPMISTWINGRRYNDDRDAIATNFKSTPRGSASTQANANLNALFDEIDGIQS